MTAQRAAIQPRQEFHIRRRMREELSLQTALFSISGTTIFADLQEARRFAHDFQRYREAENHPEPGVRAGDIIAMGLLDEAMHHVLAVHRTVNGVSVLERALSDMETQIGSDRLEGLLRLFCTEFPPAAVYRREQTVEEYLDSRVEGLSGRARSLEEMLLLRLTNDNPACRRYGELFAEDALLRKSGYEELLATLEKAYSAETAADPGDGRERISVLELLKAPSRAHPDSLENQLSYVREKWAAYVGNLLERILRSMDVLREEAQFHADPTAGPPPAEVYRYDESESERFSPDTDWMPGVVMMAKSSLVWLHQLRERYDRDITRLDQVPDEELDRLAAGGFNALWLIGLWERSPASRRIKHLSGNPEAEASAYALYAYDIAAEIGGWQALEGLRRRCAERGIRLASDMVPNHTGIDSPWVHDHPDWFIHLDHPPYPAYSFGGENLSGREGYGVFLEDHYFDRSDAAVVFKHVDTSGHERYIYHGNDGTSMPWNDTAQLDYLKAEVREAVIQAILHVARNFPVIRFDAAMTLARRHVRRLWYPEPGAGGAIASRSEHGLSEEEFDRAMPQEFWREVVDRVAAEAPGTLLLAEAFWMMEGYFVRTLGMHRVYNSAFMNMLKREQNGEYREIIRNTLNFDPEVLKRFVNFMNNPDEETAVTQFGTGDKYFGVATLLATMPGLPMFGHGQIEGLAEKYGMEFRRPYWDEQPDAELISRHEREIFPLLRKRQLFASAANFRLFDLRQADGSVNENTFVYSNRHGDERVLVAVNNTFERAIGTVHGYTPTRADDGADGPDGSDGERNVATALGLSGHGETFVILQEQRSGLWHLRRSSDIREHGLALSLDGYETRVYWNVHERPDDESGHLAALERELGGGGVPDVERAIAGLAVSPVREAFAGLASSDLLEELSEAIEGFRTVDAGRLDELRSAYRDILSKAVAVAEGGEVGAGLASFERHISTVVGLPHHTGSRTESVAYKKARGRYYTAVRANESQRMLVARWVVLAPLADTLGVARALDWGVDAWTSGDSRPLLLRVMLRLMDWLSTVDEPGVIVSRIVADDEIRELIGFNEHAGVEYYHVESMQGLLWSLFAASFLRLLATSPLGGGSSQSAVVKLHAAVAAIESAVVEGRGRIDELAAAFDQSAVRQKTRAGKVAREAPSGSSESRETKDDPENRST